MEDRLVGDFVGQTNARRKVQVVSAQSARGDAIGSHLLQRCRRDGGNEGIFFVVSFSPGPAKEVLIVHAQVQREPVADLVVVLRIEGQITFSQSDLRGEREAAARRSAEEQIAPGQPGVACAETF